MPSSPSLYFDEDASESSVVTALKSSKFDVISTYDKQMTGASDIEQLKLAASEERMLFSFNARDFRRLHEKWLEEGKEHYGILLAQQQKSTTKKLIRNVKRFLEEYEKDYVRNNIFYLQV